MSDFRVWAYDLVKKVIYTPGINVAVRSGLRPFSPLLPEMLLLRFPIVGDVAIPVDDGRKLWLEIAGLDHIAGLLYWHGVAGYEPETMQVFRHCLTDAQTFLDVGANVGVFALLAALDNTERVVHAIEPVPTVCRWLRRNVELNGLGNIRIHECALSDFDGTVDLYIPNAGIATSASTRQGFRRAAETIVVRALTLDAFVAENGVARVDFLKIDTESTENLVLAGGVKTLERDQPWIICEVLAGFTERAIQDILDGLGYSYYWITASGLERKARIQGDSGSFRNYLFVPESKIAQLQSFQPGVK